jgi:Domain of unknown function (DUF6602)
MTRAEIFARAARRLRAEFEELAVVPHAASKGQEAERLLRGFLETHIPRRFAVGAGFILDPEGTVSRQTDVVVYDAFNCPVYHASEDAAIFPSNNVAAVVEVKSTLDGRELEDAWDKVEGIKSLKKTASTGGPFFAQTAGFLFAFSSSLRLTAISEKYGELFRRKGIGHHLDAICVLDRGIVTLAARPRGFPGWATATMEGFGGAAGEGTHLAVSASQLGDHSLDGFFRLLLPRLSMFRHISDHPGFSFQDISLERKDQMLTYLTSLTNESNPELRTKKLAEYAAEVAKEFGANPPPSNWEG